MIGIEDIVHFANCRYAATRCSIGTHGRCWTPDAVAGREAVHPMEERLRALERENAALRSRVNPSSS